MSDVSDLSLYQTRFCPYCLRVRRSLRRLGLELESRDLGESSAYRQELVKATGRQTVPCLRIEDDDGSVRWLHESADIIAYLEERFAS